MMPRLQSSTKELFSTRTYVDSLINMSKSNDILVNSNFSYGSKIPNILRMYANELLCSTDEHNSDCSHVMSENLLHHKTGQTSDNTYLTSILHSSDVNNSKNESNIVSKCKMFCCYHPSMDKNISGISNGNNISSLNVSSVAASVIEAEAENRTLEGFHVKEEPMLGDSSQSNASYGNQRCGTSNCENNSVMGKNEFSDVPERINMELSDFYGNDFPLIVDYPKVNEVNLNVPHNVNKSKSENGLHYNNGHVNDGELSSFEKYYAFSDNNCKVSTPNNYPLNYCTATPETSHTGGINTHLINVETTQRTHSSNHKNNNKVFYPRDKKKMEKDIFKKNGELPNVGKSLRREYECDLHSGEKNDKLYSEKKSCSAIFSSQKGGKIKRHAPHNKIKLKSYSLDDIRSGNVKIPEIIFTKLPLNMKGDNVIDSYKRNSKLLNFMKCCNDSVDLILKYPQFEKNNKKKKNKTYKIPTAVASVIGDKIGSSIIYEDKFDRWDYHPNVQNLHMEKIYEKHVFSMLKNKKQLGKKIFGKSNKFKKYNYNNDNGFWISNIDKKRLKDPEKNNSYITELVYEKNNSYDEEMMALMHFKNFGDIPPIKEMFKDNNFYFFLTREKMCPDHLNKPVIATTMRRYDLEGVSGYKRVHTPECITAIHKS
ncbi:conserved Plasmodium protein, unknown function [Plasmodium ovale]|uniref:Uncharacterized protein n=2 Tax=Plasmodium ovale TaxID=36330 RepID=A0A1A8X0F3_PLAOA|nr:conserved Plasmodium protein, unknown function [Plasmodium ovale curtisi]SBS98080.1 conserved Plasmodium protein, unknown function [Plasmodium ovale curtisi]SCQ16831.1 conserved Plasmodium protein, unknown function [Plasmodium ovale]